MSPEPATVNVPPDCRNRPGCCGVSPQADGSHCPLTFAGSRSMGPTWPPVQALAGQLPRRVTLPNTAVACVGLLAPWSPPPKLCVSTT